MFKKFQKFLFTKENIPIILVLLLASFMRLYKISEYLTFLGDEGRDVLVAIHILHGNFTLLGPTASVGGFFLGPIYYYMMAPFLFLFNYNPIGPAVMVALFGVATVWLVYKATKEFFGYYPAIVASLLYAISPLVIVYSRSSWNPNTVPFFSLLMLYLLYKGVLKKSVKVLLVSGILFGILLQLHYLSTFLGVIAAAYLLVGVFYQVKNPVKSLLVLCKYYLGFVLGMLIGWSPFLAFEVRHGFPNIQSILKFVFASGDTGGNTRYFAIIQDVFIRVFGRLLFAFPQVLDMHLYPANILQFWGLAVWLIGISAILFCAVKLFLAIKKKDESFLQYVLLLTWLFGGMLLFGFYKKPIYDYYFGILFPLPFILFGGLVSFLMSRGRIIFAVTVLVVLGIVTLNFYFRPFKDPGNNQLKQVRDISEFVLLKTDGKPYNFAVISSGGNSDYAYRYFFEVNDKPPVTIQFPGADPERKTITSQLLIVCESNPCKPLGYPLWEVAGFGQAEIAGEWPVSVLKVYKLVHYKKP
ncbi:MAG: ArnT family glycosyltransferase [Candidatus Levyibacteriota bacterium]